MDRHKCYLGNIFNNLMSRITEIDLRFSPYRECKMARYGKPEKQKQRNYKLKNDLGSTTMFDQKVINHLFHDFLAILTGFVDQNPTTSLPGHSQRLRNQEFYLG